MNAKWKAFLLLGVMYGFGFVSGMALHSYRVHRFPRPHHAFAERRIQRMKAQLHLSPQQESELRDIFHKAHERATQINEEVSWDLADIHRESVDAIRKILTPEQIAQFEKMRKKFHSRHKHPSLESSEPSYAPTGTATS